MEISAMRPRSKTGPPGPGHSYWPAWAPPTFPAAVTSASRVSHLESEPGSGSMPVAISASKFKPNGCRFLWTRTWHSFAARVASCTRVARQVLRVRSSWGRYYDFDSKGEELRGVPAVLLHSWFRVLPSHVTSIAF